MPAVLWRDHLLPHPQSDLPDPRNMSLDLPEDPYYRTTPDGDYVALTYLSLDELHELNRVRDASAGALCSFIGTTRDTFGGSRF